MRKVMLGTFVAWLLVCVPIQAAFVGGVETFDGTTLDNVTWQAYAAPGTTIGQNDALTISALGGTKGDYTTQSLQIGIGQSVSVEVTPVQGGYYGLTGVFLTNNSGGDSARMVDDTKFVGLVWANFQNRIMGYMNDEGAESYSTVQSSDHPENSTYVYKIDRISTSQTDLSVWTTSGSQIGSTVSMDTSALPTDLYAALYVGDAVASFDNVTVVPEPVSIIMVGMGVCMAACRRR